MDRAIIYNRLRAQVRMYQRQISRDLSEAQSQQMLPPAHPYNNTATTQAYDRRFSGNYI